MLSKIEAYLKDKTQELSFLTIKGDANLGIKGYSLPGEGLDVPVLTEELAASIKAGKGDEIKITSIIKGMIFTLGIDSSFKYKEEYIKFLRAANPSIEEYIFYQSTLFGQGTLEEIIFLKALITINPSNNRGLLSYGITLVNYGEGKLKDKGYEKQYRSFISEGKNILEELLNRGVNEALIYYNLAYIYKTQKKYVKAELMAERLLEVSDEELLKDHMILLLGEIKDLALYEEGYEAILSCEAQRGLPLLEGLLEQYPKWWNLRFFIGLGYRQLGDYDSALEQFIEVLELKHNQLDTLVEVGLCHAALGNNMDAVDYFELALELGGENSEILCNLAIAHIQAGDYQAAREAIEKSLDLNSEDAIAKHVYDNLMARIEADNK
ncbi:tetratricopeptide repeat protein [Alkaliphilus serpentinus]|uniref:Tetratricopeptide repeat protein n=1 Tax=Alkaliphilus serpentinus TaxID=1482731 RepID=A0A833HNC3_9FIRM|nr:tetratricopeptide repeat protein [Alkaliphilus serpentinus]KAB3529226.1 tetratricopeptide repeat protein [Alkaliphilus serpentinus]